MADLGNWLPTSWPFAILEEAEEEWGCRELSFRRTSFAVPGPIMHRAFLPASRILQGSKPTWGWRHAQSSAHTLHLHQWLITLALHPSKAWHVLSGWTGDKGKDVGRGLGVLEWWRAWAWKPDWSVFRSWHLTISGTLITLSPSFLVCWVGAVPSTLRTFVVKNKWTSPSKMFSTALATKLELEKT